VSQIPIYKDGFIVGWSIVVGGRSGAATFYTRNPDGSWGFDSTSPSTNYELTVNPYFLSRYDHTRGAGTYTEFIDLYYGNYGGAGYSQGQFSIGGVPQGAAHVTPVDDLDAAFKRHDEAFLAANNDPDLESAANKALLREMADILDNPENFDLASEALWFAYKAYHFFGEEEDYFPSTTVTQVPGIPYHCFPSGTPISLPDGKQTPIEKISVGDEVLSFNPVEEPRRGFAVELGLDLQYSNDMKSPLRPSRVARLFASTTDEWLVITLAEGETDRSHRYTGP
jgi:hypothetical protein